MSSEKPGCFGIIKTIFSGKNPQVDNPGFSPSEADLYSGASNKETPEYTEILHRGSFDVGGGITFTFTETDSRDKDSK